MNQSEQALYKHFKDMEDDSYNFQLLDVRIEDNTPKSLEYEDISDLLGDSFSEA